MNGPYCETIKKLTPAMDVGLHIIYSEILSFAAAHHAAVQMCYIKDEVVHFLLYTSSLGSLNCTLP